MFPIILKISSTPYHAVFHSDLISFIKIELLTGFLRLVPFLPRATLVLHLVERAVVVVLVLLSERLNITTWIAGPGYLVVYWVVTVKTCDTPQDCQDKQHWDNHPGMILAINYPILYGRGYRQGPSLSIIPC